MHRTRFLKNTSAVLVGLLVVFLSDTLLAASGVPHVIAEDDLTPAWAGPVKVHLRCTQARASYPDATVYL